MQAERLRFRAWRRHLTKDLSYTPSSACPSPPWAMVPPASAKPPSSALMGFTSALTPASTSSRRGEPRGTHHHASADGNGDPVLGHHALAGKVATTAISIPMADAPQRRARRAQHLEAKHEQHRRPHRRGSPPDRSCLRLLGGLPVGPLLEHAEHPVRHQIAADHIHLGEEHRRRVQQRR